MEVMAFEVDGLELGMDWLRLIRCLTQYVAPGLAAAVVVAEIVGWLFGPPVSASVTQTYHTLVLIVFSLLTAIMIGICGWIVCLWDLDRLFFKLESKIDSQIAAVKLKSGEYGNDGTLLGRARELLNKLMKGSRAMAVSAIEKSYWIDINAGGALAFPKPNIAAAVDQIEKSRRDLLAPLTQIVSRTIPLGSLSAPIVSRLIFMYFAPEIKVRLYRRLLLRFLSQLGALFVLTAICFYISILAWSRVSVDGPSQNNAAGTQSLRCKEPARSSRWGPQTRPTWTSLKGLSGASVYPSPTDTVPAAVGTVALCQN